MREEKASLPEYMLQCNIRVKFKPSATAQHLVCRIMSSAQICSYGSGEFRLQRPVDLTLFALCVINATFLLAFLANGHWLIDARGHGTAVDFVNVWAAGRLVLDGHAAAAYDWAVQKPIEDAALGYGFEGSYGWHYPPPFLAVAALLALVPYAASFLAWMAVTFPIYLATIRAITGHRIGWLVAAAFPPVLANLMVGQNGFLTAALMGGALGLMQRRPVLAGCCLGLLTYKPHFGMLFPLVLAVSGRWTVFASAAASGTAIALASWLAFGTGAWEAFFHWLPIASQAFLSEGRADWGKLQSVFGLVRILGGSEGLAWWLQAALIASVAAALCLLWRSRAAFEMKAAALATGTLLATPYLYLYDMVALAVPVAFLFRTAPGGQFAPSELVGLGAAAALLVIFPFVKAPVGFAATVLVAVVIARRIWLSHTRSDDLAGHAAPAHRLPHLRPDRA